MINIAVPTANAIEYLANDKDMNIEEYTAAVSDILKDNDCTKGKLLIAALTADNADRVKVLFELGAQVCDNDVNSFGEKLYIDSKGRSVFNMLVTKSLACAELLLDHILTVTEPQLSIIRGILRTASARLLVFENCAKYIKVCIHIGILPQKIPSEPADLLELAEHGLFYSTQDTNKKLLQYVMSQSQRDTVGTLEKVQEDLKNIKDSVNLVEKQNAKLTVEKSALVSQVRALHRILDDLSEEKGLLERKLAKSTDTVDFTESLREAKESIEGLRKATAEAFRSIGVPITPFNKTSSKPKKE